MNANLPSTPLKLDENKQEVVPGSTSAVPRNIPSNDSKHRAAHANLAANDRGEAKSRLLGEPASKRPADLATKRAADRKIVIYCRYSSEMQRAESCEDQEREVRSALLRMGIDSVDAVVVNDRAESGTKASREGFCRLVEMIRTNAISILAVDDQSRLSRAENAFAFIKDLVYGGGRFISTSEGIDTSDSGWSLKVKVLELHHGETIRGLQDKVRRGQRGRVLADDSAGDFPYGYESYYKDDDWQQQLARRGPKPKKGLRINADESTWIRQVFAWFLEGQSIGGIARALTKAGASKGRRATTPGWHTQQVHRILNNPKYIGQWVWGETTTIRNSAGRKKQVPVPEEEVVDRDRPHLRIVEQSIWDLAQTRLARLKERFGVKPGHKRRGPKPPAHPTAVYPRSLLGSVLVCAACRSPMYHRVSGTRGYYTCSAVIKGICEASFQVPAERAETRVIETLTQLVAQWPEWIRTVHRQVGQRIAEQAARMPAERERDEQRLAEVKLQVERIVDFISKPDDKSGALKPQSEAVKTRLETLEREGAEIEDRLAETALPSASDLALPDETWVREQMADWSMGLTDPARAAAAILNAVASLEAEPIVAPGKKRGYAQLRLRIKEWSLFLAAIGGRLPCSLRRLLPDDLESDESKTILLPLGEPTLMDSWAPEIVKWREEGVIWTEIVRRTGLDLNRVYRAWKRHLEAQGENE